MALGCPRSGGCHSGLEALRKRSGDDQEAVAEHRAAIDDRHDRPAEAHGRIAFVELGLAAEGAQPDAIGAIRWHLEAIQGMRALGGSWEGTRWIDMQRRSA